MFYDDMYGSHYGSPRPRSSMATAALVCGVLSLCGTFCLYFAIPIAALGILFSYFAKGQDFITDAKARSAMWLCIVGLIIAVVLTVVSMVNMFSYTGNTQIHPYYEQYFEQYFNGAA